MTLSSFLNAKRIRVPVRAPNSRTSILLKTAFLPTDGLDEVREAILHELPPTSDLRRFIEQNPKTNTFLCPYGKIKRPENSIDDLGKHQQENKKHTLEEIFGSCCTGKDGQYFNILELWPHNPVLKGAGTIFFTRSHMDHLMHPTTVQAIIQDIIDEARAKGEKVVKIGLINDDMCFSYLSKKMDVKTKVKYFVENQLRIIGVILGACDCPDDMKVDIEICNVIDGEKSMKTRRSADESSHRGAPHYLFSAETAHFLNDLNLSQVNPNNKNTIKIRNVIAPKEADTQIIAEEQQMKQCGRQVLISTLDSDLVFLADKDTLVLLQPEYIGAKGKSCRLLGETFLVNPGEFREEQFPRSDHDENFPDTPEGDAKYHRAAHIACLFLALITKCDYCSIRGIGMFKSPQLISDAYDDDLEQWIRNIKKNLEDLMGDKFNIDDWYDFVFTLYYYLNTVIFTTDRNNNHKSSISFIASLSPHNANDDTDPCPPPSDNTRVHSGSLGAALFPDPARTFQQFGYLNFNTVIRNLLSEIPRKIRDDSKFLLDTHNTANYWISLSNSSSHKHFADRFYNRKEVLPRPDAWKNHPNLADVFGDLSGTLYKYEQPTVSHQTTMVASYKNIIRTLPEVRNAIGFREYLLQKVDCASFTRSHREKRTFAMCQKNNIKLIMEAVKDEKTMGDLNDQLDFVVEEVQKMKLINVDELTADLEIFVRGTTWNGEVTSNKNKNKNKNKNTKPDTNSRVASIDMNELVPVETNKSNNNNRSNGHDSAPSSQQKHGDPEDNGFKVNKLNNYNMLLDDEDETVPQERTSTTTNSTVVTPAIITSAKPAPSVYHGNQDDLDYKKLINILAKFLVSRKRRRIRVERNNAFSTNIETLQLQLETALTKTRWANGSTRYNPTEEEIEIMKSIIEVLKKFSVQNHYGLFGKIVLERWLAELFRDTVQAAQSVSPNKYLNPAELEDMIAFSNEFRENLANCLNLAEVLPCYRSSGGNAYVNGVLQKCDVFPPSHNFRFVELILNEIEATKHYGPNTFISILDKHRSKMNEDQLAALNNINLLLAKQSRKTDNLLQVHELLDFMGFDGRNAAIVHLLHNKYMQGNHRQEKLEHLRADDGSMSGTDEDDSDSDFSDSDGEFSDSDGDISDSDKSIADVGSKNNNNNSSPSKIWNDIVKSKKFNMSKRILSSFGTVVDAAHMLKCVNEDQRWWMISSTLYGDIAALRKKLESKRKGPGKTDENQKTKSLNSIKNNSKKLAGDLIKIEDFVSTGVVSKKPERYMINNNISSQQKKEVEQVKARLAHSKRGIIRSAASLKLTTLDELIETIPEDCPAVKNLAREENWGKKLDLQKRPRNDDIEDNDDDEDFELAKRRIDRDSNKQHKTEEEQRFLDTCENLKKLMITSTNASRVTLMGRLVKIKTDLFKMIEDLNKTDEEVFDGFTEVLMANEAEMITMNNNNNDDDAGDTDVKQKSGECFGKMKRQYLEWKSELPDAVIESSLKSLQVCVGWNKKTATKEQLEMAPKAPCLYNRQIYTASKHLKSTPGKDPLLAMFKNVLKELGASKIRIKEIYEQYIDWKNLNVPVQLENETTTTNQTPEEIQHQEFLVVCARFKNFTNGSVVAKTNQTPSHPVRIKEDLFNIIDETDKPDEEVFACFKTVVDDDEKETIARIEDFNDGDDDDSGDFNIGTVKEKSRDCLDKMKNLFLQWKAERPEALVESYVKCLQHRVGYYGNSASNEARANMKRVAPQKVGIYNERIFNQSRYLRSAPLSDADLYLLFDRVLKGPEINATDARVKEICDQYITFRDEHVKKERGKRPMRQLKKSRNQQQPAHQDSAEQDTSSKNEVPGKRERTRDAVQGNKKDRSHRPEESDSSSDDGDDCNNMMMMMMTKKK